MNTKEILTLQFGPYSNYVGAHWWNMQELSFQYSSNNSSGTEINHDVLFREGQTSRRETTYTPRLLLTDLKQNLKSLSEQGTLYDEPLSTDEVDALWMNRVEKQVEEPITKSDFQKEIETRNQVSPESTVSLYENVNVWSDFLYTRFHPRTVNVIKQMDSASSFDSFPLGCALWKNFDYQENFTDNIRCYIEECDHLQGFQVLMDGTDAFSGLGTSCIEYLRDEFSGKSVFAMPLLPSYYADYNSTTDEEEFKSSIKDSLRNLNLMFSFAQLYEEVSIFVPLSVCKKAWRKPIDPIKFNLLEYDIKSDYETSAILASAIDTFSHIYRLKNTQYSLNDLTAHLTRHSRKAVAASLCLPFSINEGASFLECLDKWDGPLSNCITPNCVLGNSGLTQVISLRGIPEQRLKLPLEKAGLQRDLPAYKCNSVKEMLEMFYSFSYDDCATSVSNSEVGLCTKLPFPQKLFDNHVGTNGNVCSKERSSKQNIDSVPILAGLHSGSEIGNMIESLHSEMRRIKLGKFPQFTENGFGKDEFEECLDKMFTFRENYEDNYFL